jgi:hypothetical protein
LDRSYTLPEIGRLEKDPRRTKKKREPFALSFSGTAFSYFNTLQKQKNGVDP